MVNEELIKAHLFWSPFVSISSGEATCFRHRRWSHGAYWSGIREGQFIVEELNGIEYPDPILQFCDEAPGGGLGNPFIRPPKSA